MSDIKSTEQPYGGLDVEAFNSPHRDRVLTAREKDAKIREDYYARSEAVNAGNCDATQYCADFVVNMHFMRRRLQHAALNGVGTKMDTFSFCPYCGVKVK